MNDVRQVEENLAVIRRLMERGVRYEAITGTGGLLAGLAAAAAAALVEWGPWRSDAAFVLTWSLVAVGVVAWVALQGLRGSWAGEPDGHRLSSQARAVALEVLPATVAAAILTVLLWEAGRVDLLPPAWMLLHGVAILSTAHHAPRRLAWLGAAFLAAGATVGLLHVESRLVMAIVFGGFHIAHGIVATARPLRDEG